MGNGKLWRTSACSWPDSVHGQCMGGEPKEHESCQTGIVQHMTPGAELLHGNSGVLGKKQHIPILVPHRGPGRTARGRIEVGGRAKQGQVQQTQAKQSNRVERKKRDLSKTSGQSHGPRQVMAGRQQASIDRAWSSSLSIVLALLGTGDGRAFPSKTLSHVAPSLCYPSDKEKYDERVTTR